MKLKYTSVMQLFIVIHIALIATSFQVSDHDSPIKSLDYPNKHSMSSNVDYRQVTRSNEGGSVFLLEGIEGCERLEAKILPMNPKVRLGDNIRFEINDSIPLSGLPVYSTNSISSSSTSWQATLICNNEDVKFSSRICAITDGVKSTPPSYFTGMVRSCEIPTFLTLGPIGLDMSGCILEIERSIKFHDRIPIVHRVRSNPIVIDLSNTDSIVQPQYSENTIPVILLSAEPADKFLEIELNAGEPGSLLGRVVKCNTANCYRVDIPYVERRYALSQIENDAPQSVDSFYYCTDTNKFMISSKLLINHASISIQSSIFKKGITEYSKVNSAPFYLNGCVHILHSSVTSIVYRMNCPATKYSVRFFASNQQDSHVTSIDKGMCTRLLESYSCIITTDSQLVKYLTSTEIIYNKSDNMKHILIFTIHLSTFHKTSYYYKIEKGQWASVKVLNSSELAESTTIVRKEPKNMTRIVHETENIKTSRIRTLANRKEQPFIPEPIEDSINSTLMFIFILVAISVLIYMKKINN